MSLRDYDRRTYIADTARAFTQRRIDKREFLRRMTLAGMGFSGFASTFLGQGRPFGGLTNIGTDLVAAETSDDVKKWLTEVGAPFKGTTIRFTSEATPPTIVANQIAKDEFTAAMYSSMLVGTAMPCLS